MSLEVDPGSAKSMFRSSRRQSALDFDLLVPEQRSRKFERPIFEANVEDAVFVDIKDEPAHHFANNNRAKAGVSKAPSTTTKYQSILVWVGALERGLRRLSVDSFALIIAAVICSTFLLSGGFAWLSQGQAVEKSQSNPLGISYVNVFPEYVDGQEVLVIRGVIENNGAELLPVPKILASLGAQNGGFVASMIIQPPIEEIQPGNSHGFSAKLRHPGGKTPEIKLSFMQTDVSQR